LLRGLENLLTPYLVPIKANPSGFQRKLKETKNAIEAYVRKMQICEFEKFDPRTCCEWMDHLHIPFQHFNNIFWATNTQFKNQMQHMHRSICAT
jgi:hypothetical protein